MIMMINNNKKMLTFPILQSAMNSVFKEGNKPSSGGILISDIPFREIFNNSNLKWKNQNKLFKMLSWFRRFFFNFFVLYIRMYTSTRKVFQPWSSIFANVSFSLSSPYWFGLTLVNKKLFFFKVITIYKNLVGKKDTFRSIRNTGKT